MIKIMNKINKSNNWMLFMVYTWTFSDIET